eukprot:NODE_3295_length_574_cov_18.813333_g2775_i0.p2 GENE.NODE_3295_length_574_cov_18.813333_g2775_i0~~NODE_3295_length_574_cov_18.813333_g2775_i0.p2  ORF type:complete len:132 (-),score=35.77 NODE_3295_length_574_cov_18.813333_g2775_i0:4-399(-)
MPALGLPSLPSSSFVPCLSLKISLEGAPLQRLLPNNLSTSSLSHMSHTPLSTHTITIHSIIMHFCIHPSHPTPLGGHPGDMVTTLSSSYPSWHIDTITSPFSSHPSPSHTSSSTPSPSPTHSLRFMRGGGV